MGGRWSNGQIELFYALGKICKKVGQEGAAGMYAGKLIWEIRIG